ncbi:hypothetical protein LSH36_110g05116 [Paralvinella palmiformis]|uniref:Transmembrane protein 222 n=1 Tax=Paralvinella palmiformis TaxID=53620 RepID=A0AAD9NC40_9ANNE|nr:hypothetical protein LSH36_110g05116 [Paralvinella palmiformis]
MADVDRHSTTTTDSSGSSTKMSPGLPLVMGERVDHQKMRYPHCIVWTPIPLLTWLCPIIGHMGIATSQGVIRDFAGPYLVSEDNMAFGNPTKYWMLPYEKISVHNQRETWDRCVYEASEEYKGRMHNLCCDNCHSHVAYALNLMNYGNSSKWNMINLCFLMLIHSKYVSVCGVIKTWLPFVVLALIIIVSVVVSRGI